MSSRAFRKLHGEPAIHIAGLEPDADSSSEDERIIAANRRLRKKNKKAAAVNPFQLVVIYG